MMATKDLLDVVVRIVVTETLQARLPALHSALHGAATRAGCVWAEKGATARRPGEEGTQVWRNSSARDAIEREQARAARAGGGGERAGEGESRHGSPLDHRPTRPTPRRIARRGGNAGNVVPTQLPRVRVRRGDRPLGAKQLLAAEAQQALSLGALPLDSLSPGREARAEAVFNSRVLER